MRDNVLPAIDHALQTHGSLTNDLCRVVAILTEEVGEVAEEALGATRSYYTDDRIAMHREHLVKELAQVASTAILAIVDLKEGT